jgi:hypothetical protein
LDHVWEILLDSSLIVGVGENGIARGLLCSLFSYKYTPHESNGVSEPAVTWLDVAKFDPFSLDQTRLTSIAL